MRKLGLLLLSFFILTACSNSEEVSTKSAEKKETQQKAELAKQKEKEEKDNAFEKDLKEYIDYNFGIVWQKADLEAKGIKWEDEVERIAPWYLKIVDYDINNETVTVIVKDDTTEKQADDLKSCILGYVNGFDERLYKKDYYAKKIIIESKNDNTILFEYNHLGK